MGMMRPLLTPLVAMVPPSLDLDLTAEYVDPSITFTRAGFRYYYDSAGTRRRAEVNEWPREYDPSTVTAANYFIYSNTLSASSWLKAFLTVTPVDGATAWRVDTTSAAGNRACTQSVVCTAGSPIYVSATVKAGTITQFRLRDYGGTGWASFNLTTLATSFTGTFSSATITPVGDGFYRVEGMMTPTATGVRSLGFQDEETTIGHYFIRDLQASFASHEYIQTYATPVGNAACLGRAVWESRTNLVRQSNSLNTTPWVNPSTTGTPGTDIGADGTLSLATVTVTAGGGRVTQAITISSGAPVCLQVVAKRKNCDFLRLDVSADNAAVSSRFTAWFNLATGTVATTSASVWTFTRAEIVPLPNGLFLCVLVGTTSGITTAYVVARPSPADGFNAVAGNEIGLGDVQAEAALFPSPYILTTTVAATRAVDAAVINNLDSFGYSVAGGGVVVDCRPKGATNTNPMAFQFSNGTVAERIMLYGSGNNWRAAVAVGGVSNQIGDAAGYSTSGSNKLAFFFQAGACRLCLNGGSIVQGAVAALSSVNRLHLGGQVGPSNSINGTIRRLRYWSEQLADLELQALTSP